MADLDRATALLTSPEAAGLLRAALTGRPHGDIPGFSASLIDLHHRPGAEVTGVYEVGYGHPEGRIIEHLCATSADLGPLAARVARDDLTFHVWRHPGDPRLPGLAAACDPDTVLGWLAETGITGLDHLDLELLVYRPLRRAVLRYRADDREVFAKVLRPSHVARFEAQAAALADAGLSAPVLSHPVAGVILLGRVPGRPLLDVLSEPDPPTGLPQAILALLDQLPAEVAQLPRRPSWSDDLCFHTASALAALPDEAVAITTLSERLRVLMAPGEEAPLVPTHGDLYEANIFAEQPGRLWLIDADRVGPGRRADDLACLLAHLSVIWHEPSENSLPERIGTWLEFFESTCDPRDLRSRTATVVLSLVASDPAWAAQRLGLSILWADAADAA